MLSPAAIALIALAVLLVVVLIKGAVIVPQKTAAIMERLGKYSRTLEAGFHVLIPFVDRIAYSFSLKEEVIDVPAQICITKDNVSVEVDGIIYLEVQDAFKSAYGIDNYLRAASQLAQTTLRSAIGKIDLDKTFEEREKINNEVIDAIDQAAMTWGVKVLRYEIKDITPPLSVKEAMEAQMTAERQKRANIATSEGLRQSMINQSEGEKQKQINEAEGKAAQVRLVAEADAKRIELVAGATAQGILLVADAVKSDGGIEALNMRLAEQYIREFGNLAKETNTVLMPANVADVAGVIATAMSTVKEVKGGM
ncbi:paraslipin [Desulfovibrio subterraneus]|uniref:Paraslipin n=1 Tax=Desulfovibrio subterraneus TaxID=2718620 RepID=A0A7J0BII1_9BACT|nr:stomatin-like protein [Desulfovibrio subterraneus]WBF67628.1 paraslipin [Desulfovibrio subterraneus]GFM33459.1 paraslipin [Desulfovibrio subterraneus]